MPSESDKWGWEHVSVFGGFDRGSGTKRWKCNHCNLRYNGSYSRVRAHLLGFSGVGVKSCPAVDRSLREAFQILEEERLARKKKRITGNGKITKRIHSSQSIVATKPIPKEDVDETIARFFYADGLNVNVLNSTYFNEMVKAIASVGPGYELPSMNKLSDCFLSKEKGKLEKFLGSIKESWSQTGCTIICVSRLGGTPGCSEMGIFVSSPRGLVFLKMLDIDDSDKAGNLISSGLSDIILEIGPNNVLQIISNLGHACKSSEPLLLSKFPHIFWSPCTSHSIRMLMEEIAGLDWVKSIISGAKDMEQQMMYYQRACSAVFPHNSFRESSDLISAKFASSYSLVRNILELKQSLREVVVSEEFKQWKLNVNMQEVIVMVESAILGDDFWGKAHFFVQLCEPFVKSLATFDIEKSAMGTVYDWRIQSLEAVRSQGIDATAISHLETLVENKWDGLFSPLHAAGFILNPRYFGKGQNKDKTLMRGWKATLEKYECDGSVRRILREQLSSYWHSEGAFGEEDAVDFRDKMEPVAWWENFGFETPQLQTLAIKVLSQLSSVGVCEEIWRNSDFPFREAGNKLGVDRVEDLVFVRSNLRLSGYKNGNLISHPPSGIKTWDASQLDHTLPLANIHDKL